MRRRRVPRGCSQVKGCHLERCGCQGNKNFAQLFLRPLFWLPPSEVELLFFPNKLSADPSENTDECDI